MKRIVVGALYGALGLLVLGGCGALWLQGRARERMERRYETHRVEIPVPYEQGPDALERAVARGEHLVRVRYGCIACHGPDLGGGVMLDDPAVGRWPAPNLTLGEGSRTRDYTMADWDRIVRHGVLPDGRPAFMPSGDFERMSDRELSDIVAYIRSLPPVRRTSPRPGLGPVGVLLMARGRIELSAERLAGVERHPAQPPEPLDTLAFGRHLVQPCVGCHGPALEGGPIPFGPPAWPPAANLTPSEEGLGRWSLDDFRAALRRGVRPDGSRLRVPMADVVRMTAGMTDRELEALWAYLRSLPPRATDG